MHKSILLLPLLAACSMPRFTADRTVTMTVPVGEATTIHCETHNGDIAIERGDQADVVELVADLTVRGHTQEQANEHLALMSVTHSIDSQCLRIRGEHPRLRLQKFSPRYSFTLRVPEHMALDLESHNGNITAVGTKGAVRATTHNGKLRTEVRSPDLRLESHNGDIEAIIATDRPLASTITTHNGDVTVQLSEGAHGWLEANTHNGSITPPRTLHEATIKRRSLRCRIGEEGTEGHLQIETHNGDVTFR